jgi:hypothetical protein
MDKYQIAELASFCAAHAGKAMNREDIQTLERLALPTREVLAEFLGELAEGRRSGAIKAFQVLSGLSRATSARLVDVMLQSTGLQRHGQVGRAVLH